MWHIRYIGRGLIGRALLDGKGFSNERDTGINDIAKCQIRLFC